MDGVTKALIELARAKTMDEVTEAAIKLARAKILDLARGKFLDLLQRQDEHHLLIRNEIEQSTIKFVEWMHEYVNEQEDVYDDEMDGFRSILDISSITTHSLTNSNARAQTNATTMDIATTTLLNFIKQRDTCHPHIRDSWERRTIEFVSDLESSIQLFPTQCAPLIEEGVIAMPFWVRVERGFIIEQLQTRNTTVTDFVGDIEFILDCYLNEFEGRHNYLGLDYDRETEVEMENAFRIFPNPLKDAFPLMFLCNSIKSLLFIPKILQLRMELCDPSDVGERGGLLSKYLGKDDDIYHGRTTLQLMVTNADFDVWQYEGLEDYALMLERMKKIGVWNQKDHEQLRDERLATVLERLKVVGILNKEDLAGKGLLSRLCYGNEFHFPERRFQFLVDWAPELFTHEPYDVDDEGNLNGNPLLHAVEPSIRGFRIVLMKGLRMYPQKKGIQLLFDSFDATDKDTDTPFTKACKKYGREETLTAIEDTLNECPGDPYDASVALLSAALEENISLDCVYFILRRNPDVLKKLLTINTEAQFQNLTLD